MTGLPFLRDDEGFIAKYAPERFLQERLNDARRLLETQVIACEEDVSRSCQSYGDLATCNDCGGVLCITHRGAADV
jgi:hypothetical protein